ncbi:MAG: winged helix-turn-helix domain-containing protein, partial [Nitrospiraceae bacterium]
MKAAAASPRVIRFGVFEADLQAGELRKHGLRIKLHGQPFETLAMLLEQPGEVVTREALRQRLWPEDTFVDFDHSLNKAVSKLREALRDSANTPRFVETIPRRGYRFIAPVEGTAVPDAGIVPGLVPLLERTGPAGGSARLVWRLAGLGIALMVLVGLNVGGGRDKLLGGAAPREITSIAVLPLENLSGDSEQDYFTDGMTEALISELGKISALRVISRQSVMQFKGTNRPVSEIAQVLGVDAVVEGSVFRADPAGDGINDRVRISAQLIQAVPERHLWAESYERDLTNVLSLQGEIARAIAREINITVTLEEQLHLASARLVNHEAYEAYLRGHYYLAGYGPAAGEARTKALEYFQQAIELDPTYALAHAGLARAYRQLERTGVLLPKEAYPRARTAALKALELDESLAEAYTELAYVKLVYDWDWQGAEREFKRALGLNSSSVVAHSAYSWYLSHMGRHEEAIAEARRALELDPVSWEKRGELGQSFTRARQYDQAIEQFRTQLELKPDSVQARHGLVRAYRFKGMVTEARTEFEQMEALRGSPHLGHAADIWHAKASALMGKREEALKLLDETKKEWSERGPILIAGVYAVLGEKDQAFAWLEKSYAARETGIVQLKSPQWDSLRDDPRFQDLLRRMNFPE